MNSLRDRNNTLCVSDKLISNLSIGILSGYNSLGKTQQKKIKTLGSEINSQVQFGYSVYREGFLMLKKTLFKKQVLEIPRLICLQFISQRDKSTLFRSKKFLEITYKNKNNNKYNIVSLRWYLKRYFRTMKINTFNVYESVSFSRHT